VSIEVVLLVAGVLGRKLLSARHVLDDEGVLSLVGPILAATAPEEEDGEDPNHPEENADATTEDEGDGAGLPRTERDERGVDPLNEVLIILRTGTRRAQAVVVWVRDRSDLPIHGLFKHLDSSGRIWTFSEGLWHDERQDVDIAHGTVGLHGLKAEGLAEGIRDVQRFVLQPTAAKLLRRRRKHAAAGEVNGSERPADGDNGLRRSIDGFNGR